MAVFPVRSTGKFVGLSTDTKPTADIQPGSTLLETNTGLMFIFNGHAWLPKSYMPETTINYNQISLAHTDGAGDKVVDVMTATTQNLFIDAVVVHVPQNLSAVASFTGISVQTNDDPVVTILSSTDGAKAKLTGNFYHVYRGPIVTAATKKIQITIKDATGPEASFADITVLWRPVVAGGYYLNA